MSKISFITIDSNEPPDRKALKFKLPSDKVTVSHLGAADYVAAMDDGAIIAIERKAANDLLGTIAEKRLMSQCARTRALTPWAYLLIEGDVTCSVDGYAVTRGRGKTKVFYNSMWGRLASAQQLGITVVFARADDASGTEAAILRLCNRSRGNVVIDEPQRHGRFLSHGERVLSALPGVGIKTLDGIMEDAGAPGLALEMLTGGCDKSPYDSALSTKIRNALGITDGCKLAVVDKGE